MSAAPAKSSASSLPAWGQPGDWQARVLQALGAPWSTSPDQNYKGYVNVNFLNAWAEAEGTKARYNPLATALKLPGSGALANNQAGVQEYRTPEQGVAATAATLRKYPAIVAALRAGNAQAILTTPSGRLALNTWVNGPAQATTAYSTYTQNVARNFYGEKGAADWTSFDLTDAGKTVASAAGDVGSAITGAFSGLTRWLEQTGARVLSYSTLTVLALGLVALGLVQMFGASPLRGRVASAAFREGEIPF